MFNTIILNNDEDMQSVIFEEEGSTFFKISQSIRQLIQAKIEKGFNSQRADYNEVFEIGCDDVQTCKKWVVLIKWVIKKHLLAIN